MEIWLRRSALDHVCYLFVKYVTDFEVNNSSCVLFHYNSCDVHHLSVMKQGLLLTMIYFDQYAYSQFTGFVFKYSGCNYVP